MANDVVNIERLNVAPGETVHWRLGAVFAKASREAVAAELQLAFDTWGAPTGLRFVQTEDEALVMITIEWTLRSSGENEFEFDGCAPPRR